jgi:hypothetical protein
MDAIVPQTHWIKLELDSEQFEQIKKRAEAEGLRYRGGRIEKSAINGIEHYRLDVKRYPMTKTERDGAIVYLTILVGVLAVALIAVKIMNQLFGV